MATASDIAAKINAAAVYLIDGGHHEVADALQLVLAGADDLPACMGAAPGWRSAARLRARDAALRALVRYLAPGGGPALRRADRIAALIGRYYDGEWNADRRAGRRPDDPLHGLLFDLLCTTRPLSVRTWRDLIGNFRGGDCQQSCAA